MRLWELQIVRGRSRLTRDQMNILFTIGLTLNVNLIAR